MHDTASCHSHFSSTFFLFDSGPSDIPAEIDREIVIVNPMTQEELTLEEAVEQGLIDQATAEQYLREYEFEPSQE